VLLLPGTFVMPWSSRSILQSNARLLRAAVQCIAFSILILSAVSCSLCSCCLAPPALSKIDFCLASRSCQTCRMLGPLCRLPLMPFIRLTDVHKLALTALSGSKIIEHHLLNLNLPKSFCCSYVTNVITPRSPPTLKPRYYYFANYTN